MKLLSKLFPKSLSGRLILLFVSSLFVFQVIILSIFIYDRQDILHRNRWQLLSNKVGSIVELLNSIEKKNHRKVIKAANSPAFRLRFIKPNNVLSKIIEPEDSWRTKKLYGIIKDKIGPNTPVRIFHKIENIERANRDGKIRQYNNNPLYKQNQNNSNTPPPPPDKRKKRPVHKFTIQIQLENGSWLEIKNRNYVDNQEMWPIKLLVSSLVILVCVVFIAYMIIRILAKPLLNLSNAATSFGINMTPSKIEDSGPSEIKQTAKAFNTMQDRLIRYINDRTRILSAISHDLKTPITRMRLRSEMLENTEISEKFIHDLNEMEAMITETLEFMRGEKINENQLAIDLNSFLESIIADRLEVGQKIDSNINISSTINGKPLSLKRCINNLLDNSFKHADHVKIEAFEATEQILIKIIDNGPGIDNELLDKVFEPFEQLEKSRNKEKSGFGLGLGIARNIIRGHGGDLILTNAPESGLIAEIKLPKTN